MCLCASECEYAIYEVDIEWISATPAPDSVNVRVSVCVCVFVCVRECLNVCVSMCLSARGCGLGSRPKKMYRERLGDGVEYHLMKPTPRR